MSPLSEMEISSLKLGFLMQNSKGRVIGAPTASLFCRQAAEINGYSRQQPDATGYPVTSVKTKQCNLMGNDLVMVIMS